MPPDTGVRLQCREAFKDDQTRLRLNGHEKYEPRHRGV
ncbi:hypothetical protein JYG33_17595 [Alcaligenes sp. SORT26]|nr:hypothetical protein JYG33_17595 [Alcaligenes sp. SORT26]